MAGTNIAWTDETWNPIAGCSKVDEGCKYCYAEIMANRLSKIGATQEMYGDTIKDGKWTGNIVFDITKLAYPLNKRKAKTIFVGSMSDIFHENNSDEVIDEIFHIMMRANWHTYIILTKRPERMKAYIDGLQEKEGCDRLSTTPYMPPLSFVEIGGVRKVEKLLDWQGRSFEEDANAFIYGSATHGAFPNVWFGTSIENQETASERTPHLLATKVANRMLSIEPMLTEIDIEPFLERNAIKWVIVGGESGKNARPMHPLWVEKIYATCMAKNTPFFFKQWGEWKPTEESNKKEGTGKVLLHVNQDDDDNSCYMVKKKEPKSLKHYGFTQITNIPKIQG
jgi:protein gp37